MKTLLELKSSRKLGVDHIVKAVLLDVGSPPPSEPDKQPIVLCLPPGDIKMGCNIIGKHLHIDPAEKGKVIWIISRKDGAVYLSYFEDEKKHFLTIRDGVKFDFRPLSPDVKMHNPKDRLPYLAEHFRACYNAAFNAMDGVKALTAHDIIPIATTLWIETKAGVVVPTSEPAKEPKQDAPTPAPEPEPEPAPAPKPDEEHVGKDLTEVPEAFEQNVKNFYAEYAKWDYSKLCENAAIAMRNASDKPIFLAKKEAITRLLDTVTADKDPKAWMDVYDELWQGASDDIKSALDAAVALCFEKKPAITQSAAHKIACLNYALITSNEEKI